MIRRKRVELDPEAVAEARAAAEWYGQRGKKAQADLRRELAAALRRIGRWPDSYSPYVRGTRWCRLRKFPYLVVFREREDFVQVVAVAHERQRTGYWLPRLKQEHD
jgi:plasmid stabilization system protein ParE